MKNYAVVKFLSDCSFSEIPTVWISEENDMIHCWWPPRNANCANLITNCASPIFNTWSKHKVEIIKYCSSLESARRSASDANYNTTDEERLGRGKRSHMPTSRYSSSDEGEHDETQPRKSKVKKGGKTFAEHKSSNTFTLPSVPDNFGLNTQMCNVSQQNCSSSRSIETSSQRDKGASRYNKIPPQEIESGSSSKEITEREYTQFEDIPVLIEEYIPSEDKENFVKLTENMQEMLRVQGNNIQKMLRMQASANITMKDMNQRLHKLENERSKHAANSDVNDVLIARFLPLSTVELIQEFDLLLKNVEEAVTQFKQYLLKTGGNNPKDNVHRVLKKVFTNECAMNCSMKGMRNNFRVCNLHLMKILRRELVSRHENLTETDFDSIVAEWLRFAKQRKTREEKKAREDEENINIEGHRPNNENNNNEQHFE